MAFFILVQVSGGVAGTRRALLKGREDKVARFETLAAADAEASAYRLRMNPPGGGTHYFQPAYFSAWVLEAVSQEQAERHV